MSSTSSESIKTIAFNNMSKVFEHVFGPDSTDCCFQFPTNDATSATNELKCHRKLLSALSPVFATMFNADWAESSKVVSIVDASFEDFETFLAYFYKEKIELSTDNVNEIFYLAHKYEVNDLSEGCTAFMIKNLSIENVLQYYALAIRHSQPNLKLNCGDFIALNTELVLVSEVFLQCDKNTLKQILTLTKVSSTEVDLFCACLQWAINKIKKRGITLPIASTVRNELGECFALFRFKEMHRKEYADIFRKIPSFFSKNESDDIFMHFMQTDGPDKNTRYRHVVLKNGKRVFEDDEAIGDTAKKARLSREIFIRHGSFKALFANSAQ